jgi:hypothetical protein
VLRQELGVAPPELYRRERKRTARKLALLDDRDAADTLAEACPYTVGELCDEDRLPLEPKLRRGDGTLVISGGIRYAIDGSAASVDEVDHVSGPRNVGGSP